MKFVATRELRLNTPKILRQVRRGQTVIVTKRGKPQATIIRLTEDDIEDLVLSHPSLLTELGAARREYDRKGGVTLSEARKKLGLR